MANIPKVVHQVWIDKRGPEYSYPSRYENHRRSLVAHNPDFVFKVWREKEVLELFKIPELAPFKKTYQGMKYAISRADFARMMVIYSQGGFYLDLDFVGRRPLSDLAERFKSRDLLVTTEPYKHINSGVKLFNGFIAAVPRHSFILGYLDHMERRMRDVVANSSQGGLDVIMTTGPGSFYRYALNSGYDWEFWKVPSHLIIPHMDNGKSVMEVNTGDPDDQPYVDTIWQDGTRWSDQIVSDCCWDVVWLYSLVIVIAAVLLILYLWLVGRLRQPRLILPRMGRRAL